jgi:hypothetical protein
MVFALVLAEKDTTGNRIVNHDIDTIFPTQGISSVYITLVMTLYIA